MPARRGDTGRARPRRSASRGAASVEYGLLVALIGGMLCLGIGATLKEVFGQSLQCFITSFESGGSAASCPLVGTTSGGTGSSGGGGAGAGVGGSASSPSTSPGASPTATPSPTPTPSPSVSP